MVLLVVDDMPSRGFAARLAASRPDAAPLAPGASPDFAAFRERVEGRVAAASGPVRLAGVGVGGVAACWVAAESPARVAALTLLATPPTPEETRRAVLPDEPALAAWDMPMEALTTYKGPARVVDFEDDPSLSATRAMFWKAWLPQASYERRPRREAFDPADLL
ncbi:MAG TPA: hypothetical protein VM889_11600 [Candidatus Thermoplasmatota archaeon]|nr:hypothetical protein [Candidatus Thermoplasmatota archaeon]